MNTHFRASSRAARFFTAVASCLVTTLLFGAVALGLTGEQPWGELAQDGEHAGATILRA